jgi:hypothetical protein
MTETRLAVASSDVPAASARNAESSGAIQLIRLLMRINLGLVAVQALSAGFFLSGDGRGVNAHKTGAMALLAGALVQAVSAAVLWRRGRLPGWVAGNCVVLLLVVLLEMGLGHGKQYWLHLPLGVLMFGGLTRQVIGLDAWRSTTGSRS